ncbi:TetR/AcrR family transcriptional regulator [Terracidiphilus gabretensis]|uniref:TetR/AcrR family transcriptional regulator n=1 Tax=Terracidiphilus gabretensis TaxID=1577687 RepID=UPI000AFCDC07|nr:TetR/AcrR family transcriptional regulator [Terracidiphilus gabretensis]
MAKKGETTRQMIVVAAAPIFNQRGYEGTSMQNLMEATGLEKGGLYRHFSGKEELAAEALRYSLKQSVKIRTEHVDGEHGALALLRSLVRRFVEKPSSMPGGCPLMNTAIDSDDGNPTLRGLAHEALSDWRTRLIKVISDGIRDGEIKAETVPREIANTIIAALEGALMISRLDGNRVALADARKSLEVLLNQIAAG